MKKVEEIKKTLEKNKSTIQRRFKVKEICIFGSYVRGESKDKSDLDILVEFSQPVGFFAFLDLEEYLTDLLGVRVDLVSKKALKPKIGKNILKEMIPV